ncbi:DUF4156 domain-containing protein [Pseudoalteromonas sp.]|uniref:DUF4156 domain-containing protein n=1 Tax=Pseudoalteromonas sp. TaxID=53249 RepID=UPI003568197C
MIKINSTLLSILVICFLAGCTIANAPTGPSVSIVFDNQQLSKNCKKLGDVIGSQGTIINYWFIPEPSLLQGAINTLKQQTMSLGGNTAYLRKNIDSNTSITLLGEAYFCSTSTNH